MTNKDDLRKLEKHQARMRSDWDERAKVDVFHYVNRTLGSHREDVGAIFEQGESEAIELMRPALERLQFVPDGKRILEIGCGIGRLFSGFDALGFAEIYGIDVSGEMLDRGRKLCPVSSAEFILGDGLSFAEIESDYIDYCFSYGTFHGVPDPQILWQNLTESYRVLRPGGAIQILLRERRAFKRRLLLLLPSGIRPILHATYSILRLRGWRGGNSNDRVLGSLDTWDSLTVSPAVVTDRLKQLGFTDVEVIPDVGWNNESMYWVIGVKA